MVGAEWRSKAMLAEQPEFIPRRAACIRFEDKVPLLRRAGEVVGRQPYPIGMTRLLAIEELFAFVKPAKRILLAIIGGKGEFVEVGDS